MNKPLDVLSILLACAVFILIAVVIIGIALTVWGPPQ